MSKITKFGRIIDIIESKFKMNLRFIKNSDKIPFLNG